MSCVIAAESTDVQKQHYEEAAKSTILLTRKFEKQYHLITDIAYHR